MTQTFKGRREDGRLITGAGRYTSDWNQPGQVYATFLRSDRAHAKILSIDTSAAKAAPGVLAVLTGADMAAAGYNRGRTHVPYQSGFGPVLSPASPTMAVDKVRLVGELVALVVAETANAAQDALELITVDYESLEAVTSGRAALEPGAPLLHDGIPGNLSFEYEYGDAAATTAAFASAAHVVRLEQESSRVVGNPMEPKAALVQWDDGVLQLWSSSQGITGMRDTLCCTDRAEAGAGAGARLRRRRRVRHPRQRLSGIRGTRAGGARHRPPGEVDRDPVGDLPQRLSWPRRVDVGRAGAGRRRPLPRHPPRLGLQHRRAPVRRRRLHQHAQRRRDGVRRLPHPRRVRPQPPRGDQHGADHRLSRRRPAGPWPTWWSAWSSRPRGRPASTGSRCAG